MKIITPKMGLPKLDRYFLTHPERAVSRRLVRKTGFDVEKLMTYGRSQVALNGKSYSVNQVIGQYKQMIIDDKQGNKGFRGFPMAIYMLTGCKLAGYLNAIIAYNFHPEWLLMSPLDPLEIYIYSGWKLNHELFRNPLLGTPILDLIEKEHQTIIPIYVGDPVEEECPPAIMMDYNYRSQRLGSFMVGVAIFIARRVFGASRFESIARQNAYRLFDSCCRRKLHLSADPRFTRGSAPRYRLNKNLGLEPLLNITGERS